MCVTSGLLCGSTGVTHFQPCCICSGLFKSSYIASGYWPISILDSNSLIVKHRQEGESLFGYIAMP